MPEEESENPEVSKIDSSQANYDELYRNSEKVFGSGEPEPIVVEAASHLQLGASIIEFGAGQGRNGLYLAGQGLDVLATDISDEAVGQMDETARSKGLGSFRAEKLDVRSGIQGSFDALVTTYMLHHLEREDAEQLIAAMKAHTNPGGLNIVTTFSSQGDFFEANPGTSRFYPQPDELKGYYTDWEIVKYDTWHGRANQTNPDGSPMHNTTIGLIAKKPAQDNT